MCEYEFLFIALSWKVKFVGSWEIHGVILDEFRKVRWSFVRWVSCPYVFDINLLNNVDDIGGVYDV